MTKFMKWMLSIFLITIILMIIIVCISNRYSEPHKFDITTKIVIDTSKPIKSDPNCKNVNECIIKSDKLIDTQLPKDSQTISSQNVNPGDIKQGHELLQYRVTGDKITPLTTKKLSTENQQMAQKQFEFFTQLVPKQWRQNLTQYNIIKDSNLSAYIMRLGDKKEDGQALGVDIYNMDRTDDQVAKLILIHEFAHLFSDNYDQYINHQSCEGTVTDKNLYCLTDQSYLNQFYMTFWKTVPQDWLENAKKPTEDTVKFYQLNKDKFITTYAASDPYEDFAESFTEFVIRPYHNVNHDTLAEEKIKFFYQYPELVSLRYQLLQKLVK